MPPSPAVRPSTTCTQRFSRRRRVGAYSATRSCGRSWGGPQAAKQLAAVDCDVVLNAITGSAGLEPTLAALEAGTTLALANKESLVIGGRLVVRGSCPRADRRRRFRTPPRSRKPCAPDAAARCGDHPSASGGPFRGKTRGDLGQVTPDQAMAHPTWNMGRVITINSSTLVNKGLELIEAALLYDVALEDVTVVVHPQSVVHSMVEFVDGSTLAQCSPPDMRLPIALGLAWPDRVPEAAAPCNWAEATAWTFEPLDGDAFPAVELARRAGVAAGTAPAVYNAANEECVDAFCAGQIGFLDIVDTVEAVVNEHLSPSGLHSVEQGARHVPDANLTVEAVLAADAWARERAREVTSGG